MTTNHKEMLDDALIRPGRIDHHIEFNKITADQLKNIVSYYYDSNAYEDIVSKYQEFEKRLVGKITTSTLINSYVIHNTNNYIDMASELMDSKKYIN